MSKQTRTPLKGKPFSKLSDEQVVKYLELFQNFIYCFRYEDKEKEQMLKEIFKMLSDEKIDRWNTSSFPDEVVEKTSEPVSKSIEGTKIRKRPLIRKK